MSDDKRKTARLQGKYSDDPKQTRKDKSKRKSEDGASKRKSLETKSVQPADGFELQYDENTDVSFPQLEEKKLPVEINTPGEHTLSSTDNGISRVLFEPEFLTKDEADNLMGILYSSTKWYDKNIIIHGQEVPQPRQVAWYGPFPYSYSGAILEAAEMPPAILNLKSRIEDYLLSLNLDVTLNSVLLNLYRNGKDSVAWHSDDELTMGVCPTIASVSLGEIRKFEMKIKPHVRDSDKNLVSEKYFVNLTPGSLIIMDGSMQKDWKHQIPKEYHDRKARINLTFRTVYAIDDLPAQVPLTTVNESNQPTSTEPEAKQHIFDTINFPPLDSSSSQNGNNPKVLKSTSSKSKTVSNPEAITSNQSYSSDDIVRDSSHESKTSACQELNSNPENSSSTSGGNANVPCDVVDSDYHTETLDDVSPNNRFDSAETFPGASDSKYPDSDGSQSSKSYQLNADAIEFIPKCPLPNDMVVEEPENASEYYKTTLTKLAEFFDEDKVPCERFEEFYYALVDKLNKHQFFLSDRDTYEVESLCLLFEDGQNEKCQDIILTRLCSMVKNAARIKNLKNLPGGSYRFPPRRTGNYNTFNRSRGPFKGPNIKKKE